MELEDGPVEQVAQCNPGELIMHVQTKKWQLVCKCQGLEVMVISVASTE